MGLNSSQEGQAEGKVGGWTRGRRRGNEHRVETVHQIISGVAKMAVLATAASLRFQHEPCILPGDDITPKRTVVPRTQVGQDQHQENASSRTKLDQLH